MSSFSLSFSGPIPESYDRYVFPLNLKPFADAMAEKIVSLSPKQVLETATGTGACSAHILSKLPDTIQFTLTDISNAMLDRAREKMVRATNISFETVNACLLPYPDEHFDLQISLFGLMFYDDKEKALSEAYRVLKKKGTMLMAVWDAIRYNTLHSVFYHHLTRFTDNKHRAFQDVPHNCSSLDMLKELIESAGFTDFSIHVVQRPIGPVSTADACKGYIMGTPLYNELIESGIDPEEMVLKMSASLATDHGPILAGFHRQALFIEARK